MNEIEEKMSYLIELCRESKMHFINNQDFEKAAMFRDNERNLINKKENLKDNPVDMDYLSDVEKRIMFYKKY